MIGKCAVALAASLCLGACNPPSVAPASEAVRASAKTCEPGEPLPPLPPNAPPNSTYMAKGKPIPKRYQHGRVAVHIEFASANEINRICANQPSGLPVCGTTFYACVRDGTMFMPNPCERSTNDNTYAGLFCHETAHLRGWPDIHGD